MSDATRSRNALGQYPTPPALADAMVRRCIAPYVGAPGSLRVLEPSIGAGALVSALRRVLLVDGDRALRVERVLGFEIDPRLAAEARATLGVDVPSLDVIDADFTRAAVASADPWRANVVLANPPYVRHHHLGSDEKSRLRAIARARLGIETSGLAGLYVHFVLLAHLWMDDGAIAAWVVPSEWMDVRYGRALREYLTTRVTLLGVHRFAATDAQFHDALVSSSIVWLRKATPNAGATCSLSTGRDLEAPDVVREVAVGELESAQKWGGSFHRAPRRIAHRDGRPRVLLGDLAKVSRGIATGSNGFFVRPRAFFRSLGIDGAMLRPVLCSSRRLHARVVEPDRDAWPRGDEQLALLDCALPPDVVRRDHPALWSYLESDDGQRVRRGYLCSNRAPWYAQERREPPPIVASYMGRGRDGASPLRFVWNRSDAIATNGWLLVTPRAPLASAFGDRPALAGELVDWLSSLDARELADHGRVYGGGLFKMEPRELASLDVTDWARSAGVVPDHS